jgi:hypothetical protein
MIDLPRHAAFWAKLHRASQSSPSEKGLDFAAATGLLNVRTHTD